MTATFILIPGAWHPKETIAPLTERLKAAGYPVHADQLQSIGGHASCAGDAKYIREEVLLPLLNEGKDLILVAHSVAGVASGIAVKGLSKQDRPGQAGIVGLIFMAAFLPVKGVSAYALGGNKIHDWWEVDESDGTMMPIDPAKMFYGGVSEPLLSKTIGLLQRQSLECIRDAPTDTGFDDSGFDRRRAYFHTTEDLIVPYENQKMMIAGTGLSWEIATFETAHSPFLSLLDQTTGEIIGLAKKWVV